MADRDDVIVFTKNSIDLTRFGFELDWSYLTEWLMLLIEIFSEERKSHHRLAIFYVGLLKRMLDIEAVQIS